MKQDKTGRESLRRRAQALVQEREPEEGATMSRLVHELEVHQIELELQNEELRAANEAAEAASVRFREVFEFAPIGYATLDEHWKIREINHAATRLLGETRATLIGRRFAAFVAPSSLALFETTLAEVGARPAPTRVDVDVMCGRDVVPVRLTVALLRRAQRAILLACEDISAERAKERAVAANDRMLRDLSARKDEFLGMLSHELRNPLSPIRTSVFVLQAAKPGSREAAQAIDIIDRASSHLARLVDDLLDVTRITRGKIELRRAPVELVALIRGAVEDRRPGFEARQLDLELRTTSDAVWIDADAARIVQIATNLLGNAEKFTPPGGHVTVSVESVGGSVFLRVKDDGIGIPPEIVDGLFEPFAQAPQPMDRSRGGLGLGLAMVRSLVELHGGRVAIRSDGVGHGTEVVVALPPSERAGPPGAEAGRVAPPVERTSVAVRSRRVLIIEDQIDVANSLRATLVVDGHDVQVAHDGDSAFELATRFRPEIVLCDLGLPDTDGYAVARRFRASTLLRKTCLIALSGYARPEDVARARAAGFEKHIAKPPPLEELKAVLATAPAMPAAGELDNVLI